MPSASTANATGPRARTPGSETSPGSMPRPARISSEPDTRSLTEGHAWSTTRSARWLGGHRQSARSTATGSSTTGREASGTG